MREPCVLDDLLQLAGLLIPALLLLPGGCSMQRRLLLDCCRRCHRMLLPPGPPGCSSAQSFDASLAVAGC